MLSWLLAACAAGMGEPAELHDPARAPVIAVLRSAEFELGGRRAAWCERVTEPAQWRTLRQELGGEAAALGDDWCDFEHDCVVVLVAATARVGPGVDIATLEEEGVDVVTVTQRGPSGEEVGERTACVLMVLPRRPAQLAVILRLDVGPAPAGETTLRVFDRLLAPQSAQRAL